MCKQQAEKVVAADICSVQQNCYRLNTQLLSCPSPSPHPPVLIPVQVQLHKSPQKGFGVFGLRVTCLMVTPEPRSLLLTKKDSNISHICLSKPKPLSFFVCCFDFSLRAMVIDRSLISFIVDFNNCKDNNLDKKTMRSILGSVCPTKKT